MLSLIASLPTSNPHTHSLWHYTVSQWPLSSHVIEIKSNLQGRSIVLIIECSVSTTHVPTSSAHPFCLRMEHLHSLKGQTFQDYISESPHVVSACQYICLLGCPFAACKHIVLWLYSLLIICILLAETVDSGMCQMCRGQMGYFWLWNPETFLKVCEASV